MRGAATIGAAPIGDLRVSGSYNEADCGADITGAMDGPVQRLRAVLAGKVRRTPRQASPPRQPRQGTKQKAVLALLRRQEGATIAQVMEATGW